MRNRRPIRSRAPRIGIGETAFVAAMILAAAPAASQPLCPTRPNIILFVVDDVGWTGLPFLNPPIQWEAGERAGGTGGEPDAFRRRQSPTYNRLDARLCADPSQGSSPANLGMCPVAFAADASGPA